jgi:hypothetical protein
MTRRIRVGDRVVVLKVPPDFREDFPEDEIFREVDRS